MSIQDARQIVYPELEFTYDKRPSYILWNVDN